MGREGKEIRNKGEEGWGGLVGLRELGAWRDGDPNDYDDDDDDGDDDNGNGDGDDVDGAG